jgi:hypothetical protein
MGEATSRVQAAIRIQAATSRARGEDSRALARRLCQEAEWLATNLEALGLDWLRRVLLAEVRELPGLSSQGILQVGQAWDRGRWEALKARLQARHDSREEVAG